MSYVIKSSKCTDHPRSYTAKNQTDRRRIPSTAAIQRISTGFRVIRRLQRLFGPTGTHGFKAFGWTRNRIKKKKKTKERKRPEPPAVVRRTYALSRAHCLPVESSSFRGPRRPRGRHVKSRICRCTHTRASYTHTHAAATTCSAAATTRVRNWCTLRDSRPPPWSDARRFRDPVRFSGRFYTLAATSGWKSYARTEERAAHERMTWCNHVTHVRWRRCYGRCVFFHYDDIAYSTVAIIEKRMKLERAADRKRTPPSATWVSRKIPRRRPCIKYCRYHY